MGCDIHAHAEVKLNGKWHHYNLLNFGRNYDAFGWLANVRCPPDNAGGLGDPRGVPDDISEVTKVDLDGWDQDAHSHSYITHEEITAFKAWWTVQWPEETPEWDMWLGGNYYSSFDPKESPYEDLRFVFWFDN
jgi:hypothetical protein